MTPDKPTRAERRSQFKRATAKELRANATEAEQRLWLHLRSRQMSGLRFRRQQPLGPYIVDFLCPAAKLVIELDGSQHRTAENAAYDTARTIWLEKRGYRVLRFDNVEFLKNGDAVVESIWRKIQSGGTPLPEPPLAVRPSLKGRVG